MSIVAAESSEEELREIPVEDLRRKQDFSPRTGKERDGYLSSEHVNNSRNKLGGAALTPKTAMLRTTVAFSGDVRTSYVVWK